MYQSQRFEFVERGPGVTIRKKFWLMVRKMDLREGCTISCDVMQNFFNRLPLKLQEAYDDACLRLVKEGYVEMTSGGDLVIINTPK